MGKPIMKNPYALGFWCAVVALVLLTGTYFYGIMLAHQIDKALTFLDSAALLDCRDVHCGGGLGLGPGATNQKKTA